MLLAILAIISSVVTLLSLGLLSQSVLLSQESRYFAKHYLTTIQFQVPGLAKKPLIFS